MRDSTEVSSLTIQRLTALVRRHGKFGVTLVLGVTVIAIGVSFLVQPLYRSGALLAPSHASGEDAMYGGTRGGALGILRGLQSPQDGITTEALAVLRSRQFLERFISKNQLLPVLLPDDWDVKNSQWKGKAPDLEDGYLRFRQNALSTQVDEETGFVSVQIKLHSRDLAASLANALVTDLNNEMRERAIREGSADISFLTKRLEEVRQTEVRETIASLMRDRTRAVMLAENREGYAFRVLEAAVPSKYRYYPRRSLFAIAGFIIGVLILLAYVSIHEALMRESRPHKDLDLDE